MRKTFAFCSSRSEKPEALKLPKRLKSGASTPTPRPQRPPTRKHEIPVSVKRHTSGEDLWENQHPKHQIRGAKSGAGEQFLLQACRAKAKAATKGALSSQTPAAEGPPAYGGLGGAGAAGVRARASVSSGLTDPLQPHSKPCLCSDGLESRAARPYHLFRWD